MEQAGNILYPLAALAVMIFGLASIIFLPVLPGLVIIWLPALVYGLAGNFDSTGGILLFAGITLLMVVGSLVDNFLMGAAARKTGASWTAVTLSLVAGMAGSLLWPPFGGLIAALAVLFLMEYYRVRNWRAALESTRGMALGCGWAVVARFLIGLIMIVLWGIWLLFL